MTDRLSKAERAALAARGWYDTQQRRGERLDPASRLLYSQLGAIYAEPDPTCRDGDHSAECLAQPESYPCMAAPIEEPPQWYARTMADVRPGDTIRPTGHPNGTSPSAWSVCTARCWPPTDDVRGRGSWHVIEGGGHWDDHVIQPGECCVHLDGAGHRLFRPTFGVEILLAPSEVQAIELLGGWEHRERMITE